MGARTFTVEGIARTLLPCMIAALVLGSVIAAAPLALAQEEESEWGFVREAPLSASERLDAIRCLQARIIQPGPTHSPSGEYLVRGVRVLQPEDGALGVFSYLITFQSGVPENGGYSLGDFYTVAGYYVVLVSRSGDEFTLLEELPLMPPELADRMGLEETPPPPVFTDDPERFDFSAAVFDAMDPALVEWREALVEKIVPRWDWLDYTGDGRLDFVLDIEGFEFQPASYYTVMVSTEAGFREGFRSCGYDADFTEFAQDEAVALRDERYAVSAKGSWLPRWRDHFRWDGERFALANTEFAEDYDDLIPALEQLGSESLEAETAEGSRWEGLPRYAINATRYPEGLGAPFEYYFSLARIAQYQGNPVESERWWREIIDYVNEEYDSQIAMGIVDLDAGIRDVVLAYEEWRDELYAAAEAALEE